MNAGLLFLSIRRNFSCFYPNNTRIRGKKFGNRLCGIGAKHSDTKIEIYYKNCRPISEKRFSSLGPKASHTRKRQLCVVAPWVRQKAGLIVNEYAGKNVQIPMSVCCTLDVA